MNKQVVPFVNSRYKALSIVVVESSKFHSTFLLKAIADSRPYHKVTVVESLEDIFSCLYSEMQIDVIFFDLEVQQNTENISIINAIAPEISFVHWSYCKHPEIIEYLHKLEVNSFCLKDSTSPTLISAIDSIATNPNILYVDERLTKCLPLLAN